MNPSSSSGRSISSGPRPPSSLSSRPSSSLSAPRSATSISAPRPTSRIAHSRPPSSLTVRPPSAGSSNRPQSRFSHRPPSRVTRSRLIPQYQTLVRQVTGLSDNEEDGEKARALSEYVVKQLEATTINKASASVDMTDIDRAISGHALKARVNLQDTISQGLEHCYAKLKAHAERQENDLDSEIKNNRLPDHLQFLIALSQPPAASTLAYGDLYLENTAKPPPAPSTLTWADILAEEPFEGDHWEGILDPISIDDNWDSTPSLSPLNSDDLALDDDDSLSNSPLHRINERLESSTSSPHAMSDKSLEPPYPSHDPALYEDLEARQYWRREWQTDVDPSKPFDLGDPSTLGPSISRAVAGAETSRFDQAAVAPERYINEEDMVREVLMALQGRDNIALSYVNGRYLAEPSTPRLVHLSSEAQISILETFAGTATILQSLRSFAKAIFSCCWDQPTPSGLAGQRIGSSSSTRTSEAFADAVDQEVRDFDAWCASREEQMCCASQGRTEAPLVVSLLETQKAISDQYDSAFEVVHEVMQEVFDVSTNNDEELGNGSGNSVRIVFRTKRSPAAHSTFLLDTLFSTLQEHTERNSLVPSRMLMRIFVRTAEPIWAMVGKWLKDGMSIRSGAHGEMLSDLEEEFFIESSGVGVGMMSMGLADPEFWKEGYCLREQLSPHGTEDAGKGELGGSETARARRALVPSFLKHVAAPILETGKAIGLVRALGLAQLSRGFSTWLSFGDVIATSLKSGGDGGGDDDVEVAARWNDQLSTLFGVSVDSLSGVVYDRLWPVCEATGDSLVTIIVDDCDLWKHLNAVEDLYLMKKGDALGHFIDLVFAKMDSTQSWADFHFLNTAFGDVVRSTLNAGVEEWIQLSLVRLTYRGHRDVDNKGISKSVTTIEGLQVEYAAPFPLTYIFRPEVLQKYSEIFVLLLQIRRAKHVLERILVRGESGVRGESKVFYAMRSRLSWFLNTLLNFLTTYVLHVQLLDFHKQLKTARSLDEIIHLHDRHLEKLTARCLLTTNTDVLHRSILAILDMCLHFSSVFVAYSGDTTATHDVSRVSISLKHRSRRQRRQQRNVIGFSQPISSPTSDEDEEEEDLADFDVSEGESMMREPPSFSVLEDDYSGAAEDAFGRIEKMNKELDGLVRFLRRGVESIAGGTSEAAPSFEVLAFALEDWDL